MSLTLISSGVMGAQYGSTKAQNRLGVSFLGKGGLAVSFKGRICSFCNGSNVGTDCSFLILGNVNTVFDLSPMGFPAVLNRFAPSRPPIEPEAAPRFPGEAGPPP